MRIQNNSVRLAAFFLLTYFILVSHTHSYSPRILNYLTSDDKTFLRNLFKGQVSGNLNDPSKFYILLLGLSTLKEPFNELQKHVENMPKSFDAADKAFYIASICKLSGLKCQLSKQDLQALAKSTLVDGVSAESLYYIVSAMKESDLKVDKNSVVKLVDELKASGTNPASMAYILPVLSKIGLSKTELRSYLLLINQVLDRADSRDDSQLYFDRGLYTTALLTRGISDLIAAYGEPWPELPQAKLTKLINFVRERCRSNNLRAAAHLVAALKAIATNPVLNPVVFVGTEADSADVWTLHPTENPLVRLRLSGVWDKDIRLDLASVTVKAGGLYAVDTGVLIGPAERGLFSLEKDMLQLSLASKEDGSLPQPGLYNLTLSAGWSQPNDTRLLLGARDVVLPIRVVTDARWGPTWLQVHDDADDHVLSDLQLNPEQKPVAGSVVRVESGQRLVLRTQLTSAHDSKQLLQAHQLFAQLTHQLTGQLITFVCQSVGTGAGRQQELKLSVDRSAKDFDHMSGVYKLELIAADAFIRNPLRWHLSDVSLSFPEDPEGQQPLTASTQRLPSTAGSKRTPLAGASGPRPPIEHLFREPDRKAPPLVASVFTVACGVPLFGLFVGWLCLGLNFGNFRFSLSALVFHFGLIGIFALYVVYWLRLNMFTTLGYLGALGVPTFLAGVSVLRQQLHLRQGRK